MFKDTTRQQVYSMSQLKPGRHEPQVSIHPTTSDNGSQLDTYRNPSKQGWMRRHLPWLTEFFPKYEHWHPGWASQFPWAAFICLCGVIVLSGATFIVLHLYDGRMIKSHTEWNISVGPNVWVSLLNNISGILLAAAIAQAVAISWWRRVMKDPVTVEDLHIFWSFGSSLKSVLTNLSKFNIIAFTFVVAKISILDNLLFQKSIGTQPYFGPLQPEDVLVYSASTFPMTGTANTRADDTASMRFETTSDYMSWDSAGDSYDISDLFGFGCSDVCSLSYTGIGFWSNCSYSNTTNINRASIDISAGWDTLFRLEFDQRIRNGSQNYSYIEMKWSSWSPNSISDNENCTGSYEYLTCDLRPAVIEYPIAINNYSIFLGELDLKDWGNWTFGNWYHPDIKKESALTQHQLPKHNLVEYADILNLPKPGEDTQLGGIVAALRASFGADSVARYTAKQSANTSSDTSATSTLRATVEDNGSFAYIAQQRSNGNNCPNGYDGPFVTYPSYGTYTYYAKILYDINMFMLKISDNVMYRNDYPQNLEYDDPALGEYFRKAGRNVTAQTTKYESYYITDMRYAWAAFASTLFMVSLILPGYYGYWELGRRVSLDPLEMANAFNAPILTEKDTGAGHVDGLIANAQAQKVQYKRQSHINSNGVERYCFKEVPASTEHGTYHSEREL